MEPKHNKHRLEQFSDGVFAIAITLLAIDLHVPQLIDQTMAGGARELIPLIPGILTFVLSFVTVAIFWVNHHQLTQNMGQVKHQILWTNISVLLFVTLIPFVSKVVSVNPTHPLSVLTYSLVLFAGSKSFTMLRYYVHKSCGEQHVALGRSLVGPMIYLLAVIVSFVYVPLAYLLLIIPPLFYFLPNPTNNS